MRARDLGRERRGRYFASTSGGSDLDAVTGVRSGRRSDRRRSRRLDGRGASTPVDAVGRAERRRGRGTRVGIAQPPLAHANAAQASAAAGRRTRELERTGRTDRAATPLPSPGGAATSRPHRRPSSEEDPRRRRSSGRYLMLTSTRSSVTSAIASRPRTSNAFTSADVAARTGVLVGRRRAAAPRPRGARHRREPA